MLNIFKGFSLIIFGVFVQVLWLGVCFSTIIIGFLVLKYRPELLISPLYYFMDLGNALLYNNNYYRQMKQSQRRQTRFSQFRYYQHQRRNQNHQRNRANNHRPVNRLDKYYKILESNETDSLDVIKSRYRQLIKRYHYDTTASKNLSDSEMKFNQEKTLMLNEAYELIKKERSG